MGGGRETQLKSVIAFFFPPLFFPFLSETRQIGKLTRKVFPSFCVCVCVCLYVSHSLCLYLKDALSLSLSLSLPAPSVSKRGSIALSAFHWSA